mmetsp:Transcript_18590/g.26163  ORF Transcript_18590/g.26163 Transcript_18590/m.26163 type:complete len:170 (+) Transcript_18590:108-617(+)|eukprot:CAMPEP_0184863824 /NCGR_PEP_ID=MMETSP0580-20130426/12681_1 /TAXON_ID=1118495 /ORGANISM="Dactyliosolen fragilissimus" /LENGTH=169 /DNA_ID=CAMNT_0027362385 /DNA_START=37 /DNA_END=546 /DNA_ORIENTATION=-
MRFSSSLVTIVIGLISSATAYHRSTDVSKLEIQKNKVDSSKLHVKPFGLPHKLLNSALTLRGGEVLEPSTLEDVNAIILKASAQGKLVIIDFSATWCGPCKLISPKFRELSESIDAVFIKVDVDENPETAAKYSVSSMPTFIFIKKGDIVDKLIGANPMKLEEMIEEFA